MTTHTFRRFAILAAALVAPLTLAGAAFADGEHHQGPPGQWGPPLIALCADPAAAAAAGYNVIILNNMPNVFTGTAMDDAIYALGGNDVINGAQGNDLICLGEGNDKGNGNPGNDAVFGENGKDLLRGATNRDYLDGGALYDKCDGGPQADAANQCEVVVNVP